MHNQTWRKQETKQPSHAATQDYNGKNCRQSYTFQGTVSSGLVKAACSEHLCTPPARKSMTITAIVGYNGNKWEQKGTD